MKELSIFPKIPTDAAPWPQQGIQFDTPDVLLAWGTPENEVSEILASTFVRTKITVTANLPRHGLRTSSAVFLGFPVRFILSYEAEYAKPHPCLSRCSIYDLPASNPAAAFKEVQARLVDSIGLPTSVIRRAFSNRLDSPKAVWEFPFAKVVHAIVSDRGQTIHNIAISRKPLMP